MTAEETADWLKKHGALSNERDHAAYRIVGCLAAELFNHEKCQQPIDATHLRKAMDAYDAAQKNLDEFYKSQKQRSAQATVTAKPYTRERQKL
jgi:hypothetical protein